MMDAETRASAAKRLLDDPLLVEVLDSIEAAAVVVWRSTAEDNTAGRERAWHTIKAAERVRSTLQGIVDNGLIQARRAVAPR